MISSQSKQESKKIPQKRKQEMNICNFYYINQLRNTGFATMLCRETSLKRNTISTSIYRIFEGQNSQNSIFFDIFQDKKNFKAFPRRLGFPGRVGTLSLRKNFFLLVLSSQYIIDNVQCLMRFLTATWVSIHIKTAF